MAVVGLPDAKYGEVISAWVVLKPGATLSPEEIRDRLKADIDKWAEVIERAGIAKQ